MPRSSSTAADGSPAPRPGMPLGLLGDGESAEIVAVATAARGGCESRAEEMGLRIGKRVVMLSNGAGPVLVKVDESRIAVDRGVAMKIKVTK
ncbi:MULTISPECIES: FeoA family protein [Anaeromyxobacter]|uniref:FeoA family protein n=1 Tax=Anaeromyxobacter TaxID=161492 RepID=UPI001F5A81C5|nr:MULTISPECIES: FeoA family protein [unclassified Anaeromyxobacter]